MSAVVGGDEAELLEKLAELGLHPANFNGGGQIVVAGSLGVARARCRRRRPPGARVIPLQVAGAFHTHYMESAVDTLRALAAGVDVERPEHPDLDQQVRRARSPTAACSST